jgi:hypothetical protein
MRCNAGAVQFGVQQYSRISRSAGRAYTYIIGAVQFACLSAPLNVSANHICHVLAAGADCPMLTGVALAPAAVHSWFPSDQDAGCCWALLAAAAALLAGCV